MTSRPARALLADLAQAKNQADLAAAQKDLTDLHVAVAALPPRDPSPSGVSACFLPWP